jgi:hypothetical protein
MYKYIAMSSCLLFADEEDADKRMNLDDLYERQHQHDLRQVSIFNKILNRVYRRIQTTLRFKKKERFVWFALPDFIFGEPLYDKGECVAYVIAKLTNNGFFVQYMHPNTLFVSWENYVPSYKRNEIKKKTGLVLNEKGEVIDKTSLASTDAEVADINAGLYGIAAAAGNNTKKEKKDPEFTPIQSYKPSGQFAYDPSLLENLKKKVTFA